MRAVDGGPRPGVAEHVVEAVAVEVGEAHVAHLPRIRDQVSETGILEVARRVARIAKARTDVAGSGREVQAVVVVRQAECDSRDLESLVGDDERRRGRDRPAVADPLVVHCQDAVIHGRGDRDVLADEWRAVGLLERRERPRAGQSQLGAREIDAVVRGARGLREIDRVAGILHGHGQPFDAARNRSGGREHGTARWAAPAARFRNDPVVVDLQVRQARMGIGRALYPGDFIVVSGASLVAVPLDHVARGIGDRVPPEEHAAVGAFGGGVCRRGMGRTGPKGAPAAGQPRQAEECTEPGGRPTGGCCCQSHSLEAPSQLMFRDP